MARAQRPSRADSLDELATTLGHDAYLEAQQTGDREYRDRLGLDLDELFERYWDAHYRPVFLSAVLAVGPVGRPASVDALLERAFERFRDAARDVERATAYANALSKKARPQRAQRLRVLRFHDGLERRGIVVLSPEEVRQRLLGETQHHAPVPVEEPRAPQIEEAIAEEPYDPIRYGVYSDWLQEQGHPRGELIALQLAVESDPSVRPKADAFFERHIDVFLGGLGAHLGGYDPRRRPDALVWRFGFLHAARIVGTPRGVDPRAMLHDLLEHPSARFLAELAIRDGRRARNLQPALDRLVRKVPGSLRKLELGGRDHAHVRDHDKGDLGRAWPALHRLRELALDGDFALGEIVLPAVRRFELRHPRIGDQLPALAGASWPLLEALVLGFDVTQGGAHERTAAWLSGLDLPNLVELVIENATAADELAAAIARSPGRARLRRLAFRRSQLTVDGVRALAVAGLELERIDIRECRVNVEGLRLLRGIAKQVEHQPQWA